MRHPRRPRFDPAIPPEILPPDFVARHDLHNYLYFRPTFGLIMTRLTETPADAGGTIDIAGCEIRVGVRAVQRSGMRRRLRRRSRPPMAARKRSWKSELRRLDLRMLKAKLRSLAKTPGLMRMRERSSPMVTSRL